MRVYLASRMTNEDRPLWVRAVKENGWMNLKVENLSVGTDALETAMKMGRITETKDLGTVMLHLMKDGFMAFFADGRCVVAGSAVEMIG